MPYRLTPPLCLTLSCCWPVLACSPKLEEPTHSTPAASQSPDVGVEASISNATDAALTDSIDTAISDADAESPYIECLPGLLQADAGLASDFEDTTSEQQWYAFGEGVQLTWLSADDAAGRAVQTHFPASEEPAGFGLPLGLNAQGSASCFVDGSRFTGVRFSAKGTGQVRLSLGDVYDTPVAEGGSCQKSGDACYDFPGFPIRLSADWQDFEIPFCQMQPEGWGQSPRTPDPAKLMSLQFRHQFGVEATLTLDHLSFYGDASLSANTDCSPACPLEAAPNPNTFAPDQSYLTLSNQLSLHTFEQPTAACGSLTRRYLQYLPSSLEERTDAPLLIALHGRESNAEGFQDFMTHGSFDELAEKSGVVVVYGNAAPGANSSANPDYFNTGTWRQGANDDHQVDDIDYLRRVIADLEARGIIAGGNDVYLVGHSSGGGLAIDATLAAPELFRGVAPLFAYVGTESLEIPRLAENEINRVLFVYATEDPGLPAGHPELLSSLALSWAEELGVEADTLATPTLSLLADPVAEGSDYTGSLAVALATRNSTVTQLDYGSDVRDAQLRVLRIEHGGHFLPDPQPDTDPSILENWGFRNQDFRMADAVWDFFFPVPAGY